MHYITKKSIKLPKRNPRGHKGDNGKVLIIGGSKDYVGAVALAGIAALRSGVDWVTIAAPEKVAWAVNCLSADLVSKKLAGENLSLRNYSDLVKLIDKHNVVLLGNGIGTRKETKLLVKKIIGYCNRKGKLLVIDADGIKLVSLQMLGNCIVTPHNRELALLLRNSRVDRKEMRKVLRGNVILLKGPVDEIISKRKTVYNKTGNAGMTKAGTGDVLAGLCAGFLAQTENLFQSAVNAAYFNGLIGDILLKKKKGFSYLASDMAEEIRRVLKRRK